MVAQHERDEGDAETMTLEAFADTIVPGEPRWPGDRAVVGASPGGGAVAAGAVDLLRDPAGGLADVLESLALALNDHAEAQAEARGQELDPTVPPFVALSFEDRTELVLALTAPDHPEKEMWVALVMFSNMAFDSAAQMHVAEAFAAGHPGLSTIGYLPPNSDGVWRFPDFSYRRELAKPHPNTTTSGSPA